MAERKTGSLRAVADNEKAPSAKALSITEAAKAGSERDLLAGMLTRTAQAIENPNCAARDLAALTRRAQELLRDIAAIDAKAKQEADEDVSGAADEEWNSEAL